jgi:Sulfotransferase family
VVAVDTLLASAREQAGLHEFGDESFLEGLEVLLRSLGEEARLNATGEAVIYPRLVGHLVNRLQIEEWYRRHPEIDQVPIVAPLFGLGLPRTGSTALSFLLAQDPGVRYLRQWESGQPCPPPSTVEGPDPRMGEVQTVGSGSHVPTGANGPMECLDLMALDFRTHIYLAFARIPTYAAWLAETDFTSTYRYERRVLKLLQWGEPPRPWRLKTPAHMLGIEPLAAVFPDATFVMTHRDPTDVLLSACEVYADIGATFTDDLDRHYIGQLNLDQWSLGIDRVISFRDGGGDHRFYDIEFRAMQHDPIGEVGGLYGWLGEPVTDEFGQRMQAWWTSNAEAHEPSVHPDPATFGLDLDTIRPRFAGYVERSAGWTAHQQPGRQP